MAVIVVSVAMMTVAVVTVQTVIWISVAIAVGMAAMMAKAKSGDSRLPAQVCSLVEQLETG